MNDVDFYLHDLKTKFDKIEPGKYYLSYSGGKDSHLLYWFIKEILHEDRIKIIGINTYMEHKEIRDRMNKNCDIVIIPEIKPMEIKQKYGIPCFSKNQDELIKRYQNGSRTKNTMDFVTRKNPIFKLNTKASELLLAGKLHRISPDCCKYLKKNTSLRIEKEYGLKPILGVRGEEGLNRKKRYTSCFTKDLKFTPLFDLTDELEMKIYNQYNIELPEVYQHIKRTGCMGCPYGNHNNTIVEELDLLDQNQRDFVCEYFKESYEVLGINPDKYRINLIFDRIRAPHH